MLCGHGQEIQIDGPDRRICGNRVWPGLWNLGILGLLGRIAVGLMWRDEALVLVHLVAFRAMVSGMLTR